MSATNPKAPASLSLYQIASEYRELAQKLRDMELDEATVTDTLEGAADALIDKLSAVVAVALEMEAEADVIESQIVAKAIRRAEALKMRAAKLRQYALDAMVGTSVPEVRGLGLSFRVRENPLSVEITDEKLVPAEFKTVEVIPATTRTTISKGAIKAFYGDVQDSPDKSSKLALLGFRLFRKKRLEVI